MPPEHIERHSGLPLLTTAPVPTTGAPQSPALQLGTYKSHKTKNKQWAQHKSPPSVKTTRMVLEPPAPDETTRLSSSANLAYQDESLQQFPSDSQSPPEPSADALLQKICSIIREEITAASRKLSSDLTKGLKELGHHTNQMENCMDLATTVLEGHEQEVDSIQAALDQLRDKLEDAENCTQ